METFESPILKSHSAGNSVPDRQASRMLSKWVMAVILVMMCPSVPFAFSEIGGVHAGITESAPNVSGEPGKILDDVSATRWQAQDGLPEDSIKAVMLSNDGYLWCLTSGSLMRFDGVKFEKIDLPATSDSSGWYGLSEAGPGTLWIYGRSGAYFSAFNAGTQPRWTRLPLPQMTPVINILREDRTNLWAVVSNGLYQIDLPQPRFFGLPDSLDLKSAFIKAAASPPKGPIWLIAGPAVLKFDDGKYDTEYRLDEPAECIAVDRAGLLWVASSSKLYLRKKNGWSNIALPSREHPVKWQIRCLKAISSEQIWVGTTSGIYRRNNNRWSELTPRDGFYPLGIQCIERREEDGNIWAGTSGGLLRLRQRVVYIHDSGLGLFKDSFTAILPDSAGGMLAGVVGGGLLEGGLQEGKHGVFRPAADIPVSRTAVVSSLLRSKDGALWIGTQGDYLWRCRAGDNKCITESPGDKDSAVNINALLEDRQGRIFAGTGNGVMLFNAGTGYLEPFHQNGLSGSVHAMLEDKDGNLWAGLREIGVAFIGTNGNIRKFSSADGLPANTVLALCLDANSLLWAGTSEGLACWNGEQWRSVTKKQGLFDGPVSQIAAVGTNLWLGTHYGIALVSLNDINEVVSGRAPSVTFKLFGKGEGMREEKCSSGFGNLSAMDASGRLWFCTIDGLVMIDPRRVTEKGTFKCSAYIDEVKAGENTLRSLMDDLSHRSFSVTLPAGAGPLCIRFSAPVLSGAEHVQFKMMLEGFDTAWSDPTYQRSVVYPGLVPGKYCFRIMTGWGGVWRESPQTVDIEIKPFFWQRRWFWVFCGVMSAVLAGLFALAFEKRRSRQKILRLEHTQALERERSRIAHDLHDDLGASLTEIGLLSAVAQRPSVAPERARQYLGDITDKIRRVVETLDEIVWAVNPVNDTVKSLGEYFCEYAQRILQMASVRCRLDLAADLPASPLDPDRRHNIFLAFNEALNNVIRHSGATEAVIRIAVDNARIMVTIADNGRGFDIHQSVNLKGEGLKSMQQRMEKIGGTFIVDSQTGQGTTIRLSVPLK